MALEGSFGRVKKDDKGQLVDRVTGRRLTPEQQAMFARRVWETLGRLVNTQPKRTGAPEFSFGRVKRVGGVLIDRHTGNPVPAAQERAIVARTKSIFQRNQPIFRRHAKLIQSIATQRNVTKSEATEIVATSLSFHRGGQEDFTLKEWLMLTKAATTISKNGDVPFNQAMTVLRDWLRDYKNAVLDATKPDFPERQVYPERLIRF